MKKLILLALFLLTGCATHQRQPIMPKMLSYVSGTTRTQLETSSEDTLQKIVEAGLQKIPLDDLYALNHFRVKMIEASRENCMVILEDRTVSSSRKEKALTALSNEEYDQYAKIMANAITLGANYGAKIPMRPNKKEFTKAFDIALDAPTSGIIPGYLKEVKNVEQDQCWILHKGLRYADEKRNRIAEIVVRYMGM
jgi:hypothetical protein